MYKWAAVGLDISLMVHVFVASPLDDFYVV